MWLAPEKTGATLAKLSHALAASLRPLWQGYSTVWAAYVLTEKQLAQVCFVCLVPREVWTWRHCLSGELPGTSFDWTLTWPNFKSPATGSGYTWKCDVTGNYSQSPSVATRICQIWKAWKLCKMSVAVTHFLRDFLPIISGPGGQTEKQTRWHKSEFWVLPPWKIRTFKTAYFMENTSRQCP